jgi:nuclear transcription Y subunit beta
MGCSLASEKCQQEKRKTVNGEDILFAMTSLGFENYGEALKIYLARYREVSFALT